MDHQQQQQRRRRNNETVSKTTTTTTMTNKPKHHKIMNSSNNNNNKDVGRQKKRGPILIFFYMITILVFWFYYASTATSSFILRKDDEREIMMMISTTHPLPIPLQQQQQQQEEEKEEVGYISFCDDSNTKNKLIHEKYDGILLIEQGDTEGAAGTIFFLFVINQLIFAEMYNLFPWIYLNNVSHYIYDPVVHSGCFGCNCGGNRTTTTNSTNSCNIIMMKKFETLHGIVPSNRAYIDPISKQNVIYPGKPIFVGGEERVINSNSTTASPPPLRLQKRIETLSTNGIWDNYFEQPVSNYKYIKPTTKTKRSFATTSSSNKQYHLDDSCSITTKHLPIVRLSSKQLLSIHIHWPYAVRAWRYGGLPPSLMQSKLTYDEWFMKQRHKGSQIVEKYYKPKQYLIDMANDVLQLGRGGGGTAEVNNTTTTTTNNKNDPVTSSSSPSTAICLGLHIRHSDKANRRKRIPVKKFLPYAQTYYDEMKTWNPSYSSFSSSSSSSPLIYLATDSHKVISNINEHWPSDLRSIIKFQQNIIRSNDTTAVFKLVSSSEQQQQQQVYGSSGHHETNIQVLVDIIALSRCQFFIHGLSAVSEAVMYMNCDLHNYYNYNTTSNISSNNNTTTNRRPTTTRRSVNLETAKHPTVDEFRNSIRQWKKEMQN